MYLPRCNTHHIAHGNKLVQASIIVMQAPATQWYLTTMLAADQFSFTKTHMYQWQCESGQSAKEECWSSAPSNVISIA